MSDVIEMAHETLDVEEAERKFTASAEALNVAYAARDSAERHIEQIKRAIRSTNAEVARAADDLARDMDSLEQGLLATGKVDLNAVERIGKFRAKHLLLADMAAGLGYLKLPEAQLALKESEISILDTLAARFAFRAKLQQARRDVLLGDVVELEGQVKVDENSGKTGEYRRLAAEHRLAADHGRQDLLKQRADLEQRRNQVLQLRLSGGRK